MKKIFLMLLLMFSLFSMSAFALNESFSEGLYLHWNFSNTLSDEVQNVSFINVGATFTSGENNTLFNTSYDFEDDNDEYMSVLVGSNMFVANYTLSIWSKSESITDGRLWEITKASSENAFSIDGNLNNTGYIRHTGITNNVQRFSNTSSTPVIVGNWVNHVFTYNGTDARIYMDGVLVAVDYGQTNFADLDKIYLSVYHQLQATTNFDGKIAELCIWNQTLTPSNIVTLREAGLYNGTQCGDINAPATPPSNGSNDTIAPSLTINSPTTTEYTTSIINIDITATDDVLLDTITFFNTTTNLTYTIPTTATHTNGSYNYFFYAIDDSGNTNTTNVTFTVAISGGSTPATPTGFSVAQTQMSSLLAPLLMFAILMSILATVFVSNDDEYLNIGIKIFGAVIILIFVGLLIAL